jgi:hypothetical protein
VCVGRAGVAGFREEGKGGDGLRIEDAAVKKGREASRKVRVR